MTAAKIDLNTKVSRNPDVAWRILGEFLIAITPSSNTVHRFNQTGAELWKMLEKGEQPLTELASSLQNRYDVNKTQAQADVLSFFKEVSKKGIVNIAS